MTAGRWPFTIRALGTALSTATGYAIDPLHEQFNGPNSVGLMRAQADTSQKPNEGSLNREDYWRRTISSWHLGAGQWWYDDEESDPARFWDSQGIDPWTKNELRLLPEMDDMPDFTHRHPAKLMVVEDTNGSWLYYLGTNNAIYQFYSYAGAPPVYPESMDDFYVLTGSDVSTWRDITTDGYHVYAAASSGGIYKFAGTDVNVGGVWNPLLVEHLWFARNRLMAASGGSLYNILNETTDTAIYEHANPYWTWNGVAEANSYIYISGQSGRTSAIYKTTVGDDESVSLDAPMIAVQLPDGETVRAIYGYAGLVLIGTTLGVRLAQPDSQGFLTYGPLLEIGETTAFEGEGKFVWAGVSHTDPLVAKTALWRLNLQDFTVPLAPAYARDIEGPTNELDKAYYTYVWVQSIASFHDKRYYIQNSNMTDGASDQNFGHFYMETDNLVTEGWLNTGIITFGMTEPKRLHDIHVAHRPLPGPSAPTADQLSLLVAFDSTEDTLFDLDKTLVEGSTLTQFLATAADEQFDVAWTDISLTLYLRREDADQTVSPVVRSMTVKARPTPTRADIYVVPIIISDCIEDLSRLKYNRDATGMIEELKAIARDGMRYDMTLLGHAFNGYIEDYKFEPEQMSRYDDHFIGTLLVQIREVD